METSPLATKSMLTKLKYGRVKYNTKVLTVLIHSQSVAGKRNVLGGLGMEFVNRSKDNNYFVLIPYPTLGSNLTI